MRLGISASVLGMRVPSTLFVDFVGSEALLVGHLATAFDPKAQVKPPTALSPRLGDLLQYRPTFRGLDLDSLGS